MNTFRQEKGSECFRDGTQQGEILYWRLQWARASDGHERYERHPSSVFRHPDNSDMFLTPYAYEYFNGVLPIKIPKNSKVKKIVIATDLDAKFWEYEFSGPPADAFDDVLNEVMNLDNSTPESEGDLERGILKRVALGSFFERAFVKNMRHMPRALFFNEEFSTALVVLSAMQSATYHLKEMAGVGCLPDTDFDSGEIHDAMMRHEWFHISNDEHLSDVQMEAEADNQALKGVNNLSLRQAWIDARVVGGFMWPFPARQNGFALRDPRFGKATKQSMQMGVVYEWCDRVFEEFYDPDIAAEIVSDIFETIDRKISSLPDDLQEFFVIKFWNKGRNDRKKLTNSDDFKNWLKESDNKNLAEAAWCYLTQAYVMRIQVSNMRRPEFYNAIYGLSEEISLPSEGHATTKNQVHGYFRESLKRLLPEVSGNKSGFTPAWLPVQLPAVGYREGPYIGERSISFTLTTFSL